MGLGHSGNRGGKKRTVETVVIPELSVLEESGLGSVLWTDDGKSSDEIATILGVCRSAAQNRVRRACREGVLECIGRRRIKDVSGRWNSAPVYGVTTQ